jgi:hypothetical protein
MELYEIEGFLRGKCLPGDLLVGESNAQYIYRKFKERDALERELCMSEAKCKGYFSDAAVASLKCYALVAENVGLKKFGERLSEMHSDLNGTGTGIQGCQEAHIQQVAIEAAIEAFDELETPATDAAIAELKAQGVDELATFAGKEYQRFVGDKSTQRKWKGVVLLCVSFAAQLRKESGQ